MAGNNISSKDKGVLLILAWLLGVLGADRFYRGQIGIGILKLITFGGCGIWALIENILYLVERLPIDDEGKLIADKKTIDAITLPDRSRKDKGLLILLSILVGALGVDRFYRGQVGIGVLKLLTFGGCGIWALVDTVMYIVGDLPLDAEGKPMLDGKTVEAVK